MFAERRTWPGRRPDSHGMFARGFASTVRTLGLATVLTATCALQPVNAEPVNPAHALAEKFSRASDAARTPAQPRDEADQPTVSPLTQTTDDSEDLNDERAERELRAAEEQRAYEEDMLARARAEADARLKADMAREQEAVRQRAEAEQQQLRAQAQARERAQTARQASEREAEARQLAERLRAARQARAQARALAAADAEARAQGQARIENARNALRQRSERLANKLEAIRARREHDARLASSPETTARTHAPTTLGDTSAPPADGMHAPQLTRAPAVPDATLAHHATVLLVMKPGNRGIRRWNKTADPMLCLEDTCYISSGAETAARRVSRRKGFGPAIALGTRAGACNHQLNCIFRDVDLINDHAWMQPIDLRIVRHDRRETRRIASDPTCALSGGHIACARTVESSDYRAWIIPEHVARQAGAAALQAALDASLQGNLLAGSQMH